LATDGWARTVSLDLLGQWQGLERNGQFRYTPPTHSILAFNQALEELKAEGGVAGRARRYAENHRAILQGMIDMGFAPYVPLDLQGHIITSFHYPTHAAFRFEIFYKLLSDKGFVIYPGKVTAAECFRIGNIGRLYPNDMQSLLLAIRAVMGEMGVPLPHAAPASSMAACS
jgi:2-aminoethylphosphonate-pyruvate transaminase